AVRLADGNVLVAGGGCYFCTLDSAELYDPSTGMFTFTGNMTTQRQETSEALLANGKVLMPGGGNGGGAGFTALSSADLYDPTTGVFSATGTMATARVTATVTTLPNGKVLVAGGS